MTQLLSSLIPGKGNSTPVAGAKLSGQKSQQAPLFSDVLTQMAKLGIPQFSADTMADGLKFYKKTQEAPKTPQAESIKAESSDLPLAKADNSASGATKADSSATNPAYQLSGLLNLMQQNNPGVQQVLAPVLRYLVNEIVQWQRIGNTDSMSVKVNDLPLRMILDRVNGKIHVRLFAGDQLLNQLMEHQSEMATMLRKKNVEIGAINVLELHDYVQQPGNGQQHNQGQRQSKQFELFDQFLKGDPNDLG